MDKQVIDIINKYKNEPIIFVTPNSLKIKILKEISNKGIYNITWMSLNELINKLSFTLDDNAVIHVMNHFGYNYDTANTYLKQLPYIKHIKKEELGEKDFVSDHTKYDIISNINKFLENKKLLHCDSLFLDNVRTKKIIIYGYIKLTNLQKKILDEVLGKEKYEFIPFENVSNADKKYFLLECKNIEEEVYHLCERIAELISNDVSINDIKIVGLSDTYMKYAKKIFNLYGIPIDIKNKYPLLYIPFTKMILDKIDEDTLNEEYINSLNAEELKILDKVVNVVNDAYNLLQEENEKISDEVYKEYVLCKLKQTYLKQSESKNKVELLSQEDVITLTEKHIFILNFNQGVFPTVNMDDDYFSDGIKIKFGLDDSSSLNEINEATTLMMLESNNNLYISYHLEEESVKLIKSSVLPESKVEVIKLENSYSIYSDEYNKYILGIKLDHYNKYRIKDDLFVRLNSKYKDEIKHLTYDNNFSNFSEKGLEVVREKLSEDAVKYVKDNALKQSLNETEHQIKLSYSSIDDYNKCAFRYYVSKVLKIDIFEETFSTFLGSLFHDVLKKMYDKNFDIDKCIEDYVTNAKYKLSTKEKIWLENYIEDIKENTNIIRQFNDIIQYKQRLLEEEVYYTEKIDEEFTLYMNGFIDKVAFTEVDDTTYLMVVDYKTYKVDIDLSVIPYGLSLQLFVYYQLIKKGLVMYDTSDRNNIKRVDFKNPQLGGFYIQEILPKDIKGTDTDSYQKSRVKELKLKGYTNIDYRDPSGNGRTMDSRGVMLDINDDVIKNFKLVSDGSKFYQNATTITTKDIDSLMDDVETQINEAARKIYKGLFAVNPVHYYKSKTDGDDGSEEKTGCDFCKFKDLCYKVHANYNKIKEANNG